MIIKRFQGKTEAEATQAAKKELGDAVVIMNVKTSKKKGFLGIFSTPLVEVTVALEEESEKQAPKAPAMTALEQLAARQKEINAEKAAREAKQKEEANTKQPGSVISLTTPDNGAEILNSLGNTSAKEQNTDKTNSASGNVTAYSDRREVIEEKLESLETLLKNKLDVDSSPEKLSENEGDDAEKNELEKFSTLLFDMMIENEVDEKYAKAILEEAEKSNKPNMPIDYLLTNIYQKIILKFGNPSFISESEEGPKLVYFVGPTGVGKTTTIAKLASKLSLEEKKKIVLVTADTYRIAAAEQLRTYANILEVPFRIVYTAAEIEQCYEEFKNFSYILVDTAGHSPKNDEQKFNTESIIHALDDVTKPEVYLVLSATTKYRDLMDIADTYKKMSDVKLIFTKLDETGCLGNLLNIRLYTGCDLSYVTYGQNVPDDIDKFNPQATVKSILGGQEAVKGRE